ncbi:zinc finger HIT domain-containing protein 3-like [Anoplophora glabripennis]|uniref:zinc finger HIT domain-containing protein 3-like n=1 Tax=Anoplophora glabripennis TaxID=217634 RepID=UPI0008741C3F|nr:zinc finger HIT domain-containing protein 3-like [Anoplophora glabripennis]
MDRICEICGKTSKYKCPRCYIYYCSALCCKKHKNGKCKSNSYNNKTQEVKRIDGKKKEIKGSSTIATEKLDLLDNDEAVKKLLTNKHLRDLLSVVDKAENAEEIMHKAMQEPIFVEFADACLRVVDPKSDDEN